MSGSKGQLRIQDHADVPLGHAEAVPCDSGRTGEVLKGWLLPGRAPGEGCSGPQQPAGGHAGAAGLFPQPLTQGQPG